MEKVKTKNPKLSGPIELIRESVDIFFKKNNLLYFVKLYALLLPFTFFGDFYSKNFLKPEDIKTSPWLFWIWLAYAVVSVWVSVASIISIKEILESKNPDLKSTLVSSWKKLVGFVLVGLLVGLIVFSGVLLLVIPGIIFGVWLYFSQFAYLDKNLGIRESLRVSKALVDGRFWSVFGRMLAIGLLMGLASMVVSSVPYLGSVVVCLFGALSTLPMFLLYKELS